MAKRAQQPEETAPLVVIGASAGGIDALRAIVRSLPPDFPAPIVLAQHVSPRRESHLREILARQSTLPVKLVETREQLAPGVIFVVPADRHVRVTDRAVAVEPRRGDGPSPSIDRVLESAASALGEKVIAVVLTGAGHDGAEGARKVKAAGGTVVVQDPETASFPSMPRALAPTSVDIVAPLEALGAVLTDLVRGPAARDDEERQLQAFLDQVRDATGIDFSSYRRPTILRRLHRRMVATRSSSIAEYQPYVRANPGELGRLASAFLIKVTEFFRDPAVYAHLRDVVLPELIGRAAEERRELRIWSAGCATGEEAYSVAIAALEAASAAGHQEVRIRVFATDIDDQAIEFARRGTYPPSAVEPLAADVKRRYFTDADDAFEVAPAVRSLVVFGQHDLAQRAPFPRIDLVVCRNVLMYFTPALQRRALQLFAFSLRDAGYLVLGKSETVTPLAEHFAVAQPRLRVFRRRGSPVPLALPGNTFRAVGPPVQKPTQLARPRLLPDLGSRGADGEPLHVARPDDVILRLPIGVVVVGARYRIASINLAARSMLGVHGAAVGEDLVHQAHPEAGGSLRRLIDEAARGRGGELTVRVPPLDAGSESERVLAVTAQPEGGDGGDQGAEAVVLVVRDTTAEEAERSRLDSAVSEARDRIGFLERQVQRLSESVSTLREANEELSVANAELRAANEDLLVSNEEVQAATEEVETLNEEMQATNEELETLNEELQATVEELNATNDHLEARTEELQHLALSLEKQRESSEAERSRLMATISSMADAVLVVDGAGRTILRNDAHDAMFGEPGPQGMEDEDGNPISPDDAPQRRAARGETFCLHFVTRDADGSRRWFEASGRPIGSRGDEGGVVVIRDITDRSLQRLQDDFVAMLSHELRNPLAGVIGYLELLERALADRPGTPPLRYAERALGQARHFTTLIDELFDVSRLRRGRMAFERRRIALEPVVRDAVELAGPLAEGRTITVDPGRADLQVEGDRGRLQQVFLNLLSNAVRHAASSDRIDVRLRRRGGSAEVSVRDHGDGMGRAELDELLERLREPGMTRGESGGGLGLGLYISSSVVRAHGGRISADSAVGRGTTFTVSIPLARPSGAEPARSARRAARRSQALASARRRRAIAGTRRRCRAREWSPHGLARGHGGGQSM